jgi:hypothetical protein
MGCCVSKEDDRFEGTEALLPKGRSGNKRVCVQQSRLVSASSIA